MPCTFSDVFLDGVFASVACIGFGIISNPRPQLLWLNGIIAAFGHAERFVLLAYAVPMVPANFLSGLTIGLLSEAGAFWKKTPSETLAFPAILPMIPGMYAYGIFQDIFKILSSAHAPGTYCDVLIYNLLMSLLVILMLVSGVFFPKMLRGIKIG